MRRGVEVDVGGVALGAGGVAGELVLVARPGVVGDLVFDTGAQYDGELGGGSHVQDRLITRAVARVDRS
jgi:hypothetical protein